MAIGSHDFLGFVRVLLHGLLGPGWLTFEFDLLLVAFTRCDGGFVSLRGGASVLPLLYL